jgi:hypothetical protein
MEKGGETEMVGGYHDLFQQLKGFALVGRRDDE